MEDFAIKVENVSKVFKLPHEKNSSIKSSVVNFYRRKKGYELQSALKDVSFEVKKGEFFGIIGRNGSGKSTMLKLLAGIYTPTKGQVHVRGSLTPFIELGVGFNPELTGRENVFLNGALLGFNRKEMNSMYKDIVDFAELKKFMDQKLKNYSSGMQVRLAFSIAIRAKSDILLIDEVLAVGDAAFQRKCFGYFEEIKKQGKTVILVSHDMGAVKRFCTRAALITNGNLDFIGSPEQVAELYEDQNASDSRLSDREEWAINKGVEITNLKIENKKKEFETDNKVSINIEVLSSIDSHFFPGVHIFKEGQLIAGVTPQFNLKSVSLKTGQTVTYNLSFILSHFIQGEYTIDGMIYKDEGNSSKVVFYKASVEKFYVKAPKAGWGAMSLKGNWKIIN